VNMCSDTLKISGACGEAGTFGGVMHSNLFGVDLEILMSKMLA
jgi:hypothetical protein